MQKVFELSQSVVVEKSFIDKCEEIQRSSSCNTNLYHHTQIPADESPPQMTAAEAAAAAAGSAEDGQVGTSVTTTCKTTKSISMSTFETKRLPYITRQDTMISNCSSPTTSCSSTASTIQRQLQQQQREEHQLMGQHRTATKTTTTMTISTSLPGEQSNLDQAPAEDELGNGFDNSPCDYGDDNASTGHGGGSNHKSMNINGNLSSNTNNTMDTAATRTTVTSYDSPQKSVVATKVIANASNGKRNEAFVISESEIVPAATTAIAPSSTHAVAQTPTPTPTTPTSTPCRPTTLPGIPSPAPSQGARTTTPTPTPTASEMKTFNIPQQKPLKSQTTEKDCTVPYNIINNYFSVGVVSTNGCYPYTNMYLLL